MLLSRCCTALVSTAYRDIQVIHNFKCDVPLLLETFKPELIEPTWPPEEADRLLLQHLQRSLQAENLDLADFGVDNAPEAALFEEPPADAAFLPDAVSLQEDQQRVFDAARAHLDLLQPDSPCWVHVEGEAGGGKSFFLRALLNYARHCGHSCLPAAFPCQSRAHLPRRADGTLLAGPQLQRSGRARAGGRCRPYRRQRAKASARARPAHPPRAPHLHRRDHHDARRAA